MEKRVTHRFTGWAVAAGLLLLAFALRVVNLGGPSLWYDEAYLWWTSARISLGELLTLSAQEIIPPLYYLLLRSWLPLAGGSELALRYPAALLGVLGVAALGRISRRLTGRHSAQAVGLWLAAIATPLLWSAREVRMYGPAITLALISGLALLEVLRAAEAARRKRWAWLWAATTLSALYTLTLVGFWLMGQALFALMALRGLDTSSRRDRVRSMLGPALAVVALFLPWAGVALSTSGANLSYWAGHLPASGFLEVALRGMTVVDYVPDSLAGGLAALVCVAATLALLVVRRHTTAGIYALLYALPLGIMLPVFQRLPKWGTRHAVLFAPAIGLALAAAWGVSRTLQQRGWRRMAGAAIGIAIGAISGVMLWADANLLANPAYAREDWRGAAEYVREHRQPGDVVIVETGSVFPAWLYYAGDEGLLPLPDDALLDVNHVLTYATTAAALNAALPGADGVWLVAWLAEVTDPTALVPALLDELGDPVAVPEFHGLGLRYYQLAESDWLPPDPPLTARIGTELIPGLHLWGYRVPDLPHPADQPLTLWTWWEVDDPTLHSGRFYQMSVRLYDAAGVEWGRADAPPGGGDYRPERWPAGTPVFGPVTLTVSPWAPPGIYTPTLTLYVPGADDLATLALFPVTLSRATETPPLPVEATPLTPTGQAGPLALLGYEAAQTRVVPGESLEGTLFWEVAAASGSALSLIVTLDGHSADLPLASQLPEDGWQAGQRFATRYRLGVPPRALDAYEPLRFALHQGERVLAEWEGPWVTIAAERRFSLPSDLVQLNVPFSDGLATLAGYSLEPPEPVASRPFTITLHWKAGDTGELPYTAFVHVTAEGDPAQILTQHDSWPASGQKPTYTWVAGEVIADAHPLEPLPAGAYDVRVGLYAPDGTRLAPARDGDAGTVVFPLIISP